MHGVQPTSLTTEELIRYADLLLIEGNLTHEWQEEILKRLEQLVYPSLTR
jgi:Ni,Fe-hydrogenase III small subunit